MIYCNLNNIFFCTVIIQSVILKACVAIRLITRHVLKVRVNVYLLN